MGTHRHRRPFASRAQRVALVLYLAIACLPWPTASRGDSPKQSFERWVPSFAIRSDIISQLSDGTVQSNLRPPDDPGSVTSGDERLVDPSIGLSIELQTPSLADVLGQPSAFVHAGASYFVGSRVTVAQEGAPGEFIEPPVDPLDPSRPNLEQQVSAQAVSGQGSRVSAELQPLVVSAGAGIALTFRIWERQIRLKPSFEYIREEIEASGTMRNAAGVRRSVGGVVETPFDYTVLSGSKKKEMHGIGGGLSVELDAARIGALQLSIFADAQVYSLLGGRKVEFSREEGGNSANWSVTLDRTLYRGGVGLRFRYLPE